MGLEQAGVALIAQGAGAYTADLKSATTATNSFVDATDSGSGKVNAAGQVMIGGLRQLGSIAVDAFGKAAKAGLDFAKGSIDAAGDFEQGMKQFAVAAGKGVDTKGLEQFHDLFLQLGKDLPVSTADVQKAAIELVKGGIDPATVAAGGLKQAIQFAGAAMEGDLAGAAEVSAKIVAGWADVNATAADKADLLTHATDLFTKAANASSTDVAQLSRGIFNAQGIAKTAGVSLDDLTTTIAELSGDFSSSAEAGTSLKNMIARLQPTTDPATDAMKALGLYTDEAGSAFYDAQGNFVGFQTASQLLQDSLKGLTKEQQAATLQQIFGNDAMSAAAGLAARGADGYQLMADGLANAMGVAEAGATVQSGYNTALENTKGSVEAFQIQLGEKLLPVLTSLFNDYITPGINTLSTFADAIFGSDEAFNRLSPTLQDIVHGIDVLIADTQEIIGAFDDAGGMSSEFGESIGLLAKDLGLPADLIEDIVFAVQDLVKWFGTASDETDSLGGVLDDLGGILQHVGAVAVDELAGYQAIAQAVLPVVTRFWADHGSQISAFVETTYDKIISIVNTALDLYDAIVPPILKAIAGYISAHADDIQTILSGAWGVISGVIDGALTLIEGAIKVALDVIHGDWSKAWTDIKEMSAAFVLDLGQVIEGGLNIIAGFFGTSLQGIADTWQHNWDTMIQVAETIGDRMVDAGANIVGGIVQGIENHASEIYGALKSIADRAVNAFLEAIGAESPAKAFMPAGQYAIEGIMEGMTNTWPHLTDLIGSISKDLIGKMQDIGSQMQDAIADAFGATASIDRQVAQNLDKFKDVLPEYASYTQGALKEAQSQAEAFLDPSEGAKFFQMRSKQILEYADLQKKLADAASAEDRQRIEQQMALINAAQTAEISQFNANVQGQQSATDQIASSINAVMNAISGIDLTDDQIAVVGLLSSIWGELQAPANARQQAYANPPASPAQQAGWQASGATSIGQVGHTLNMPIYTNNSPAAVQQSLAVAAAMMP